MTHTGEFGTFFLPGPTEVRAEVLEAMLLPMLPHRGARYEALHARIVTGLQQVFRTQRPVYLMSCSATGAMEMAIRGAPEGPILSLVNGAFSERFARIAQSCDRSTGYASPEPKSSDHQAIREWHQSHRCTAIPWARCHPSRHGGRWLPGAR